MKNLLFAVLIIVTSLTSAFAGGRLSKEELDAAVKQGRIEYAAKQTQLESALRTPNTPAAKAAVADLLNAMRVAMRQSQAKIDYLPRESREKASNEYNQMESMAFKYGQLADHISVNSKQLVDLATAFAKTY